MEHVLVRYSDIGTKSRYVRHQMTAVLRQRVEDRLEYEDISYGRVSREPGRVVAETEEAVRTAEVVAEVPGVASTSPVFRTEPDIDALKQASQEFDFGDSFGVDARRAGEHSFTSKDVEEEVGAAVEEAEEIPVDLDDPDTWLGIEVRFEDAYLYTDTFDGPGGLPVGTQESLAALISGGIDSPVAAYQVMKRGCDILPVYFYNRPIAAEDHWLRFGASVEKLRRFHPSKEWRAYRVDMEDVNAELLEVGRGRMLLHRIVMFRVAEKIAEKEGLKGVVTGEAIGQKSSQTPSNLAATSSEVDIPVFRPLLTWNKQEIVETARQIGTYEDASIASACSTMAPENPATEMNEENLEELQSEVDIERLVELGWESAEKVNL